MGKLRNESGRRPHGDEEDELPRRSGAAGKLRAHDLGPKEVMEIVAGIEPGKVSLLDADPDAMSPEAALAYAGWLLDGVGRERGEAGTLASAFAFLDEPVRPQRDLRSRVGGTWRGKASIVRRIAATTWAEMQTWVPSLAPRAAAVQRSATGASWAASPVDIATRATAGGGSALPHLAQIQRSFGRHDVTRVRAYDGETARAGARQLAARAFTVGEAIGFAATPDLRLAAHEAAHVIQQRAGHAPSGGIDTPGDHLEAHADAVAEAVVAGRSAEALLDDVVGSGGSAAIGVQREGEAPTLTSRTEDPAPSGGGTERTTVGVGEKVTFTGSASGAWTATGGTASGSGETFEWTAPGSPGQFRIKLTVGDKHVTKDIGVIGPTSVKFTRTDAGGPADGAELVGAWMNLDMQVLPLNVTFKNITIREKPGGAHAVSGYFTFAQGKGEDLSHHPSEEPTLVRADNTTNKVDEASFVETTSQPWPKPFTVGSMTWHIPYLYSVGDVTDKSFTIVAQTAAIVDSKGTVTLTKGTASYSRSPRVQPQAPQRRATAEARTADPLDVATRATSGAGAPLPHLERIQDSFGKHDVSSVRAHDAGGAARELGAKAFAVGDAVGFAGSPDLHTAAHEAAHVVQQRAGARPDGGLDTQGDTLERHADRVADAVVAGRSAEGLLDELGGGGPTRAVQRKTDDDPYADDEPASETPQDWGPKYRSADKDYAKYVDQKYQHGTDTDVGAASSHGGTKIDLDAKPLTGAEVQQIVTDPGGMRADIAKKLTPEHCESVAQHANAAFRAMQMDTLESVALYLAHAAVESGATTQLAAQADPASVGQFKGRGPLQVTFKENYAETLGAMDARAAKIKQQLETEQNLTKKEKLQEDYELITKASKAIKEDPANAEKPEYAYIFSAAHMAASGGIEKSANLEGQERPEFPGNADTDSWETGEKETWAAKRARETNPDRQKYLDGVISAQKRKASAYERAQRVLKGHLAAKQDDGAVQRHAVGDAATSSPVETARAATVGSGVRLPHLAAIQASFGAHDVSNVRAHIGGAAAEGASALGASAFAVGDAVGFAASPDLRTAAHEAAHVVQQRAGHAPDGGIDRRGDTLERHADAVADTVASGGSAAPLLDGLAQGSAHIAVQRTGTAPKITVVTKVAPGGGGTARTTVGVGEKVTFKGSEAGAWTATGGSPTGANGDALEWTAPGNPGQFSIKLKVGDQETQTGISVIAPTGIQVKRTSTFKPGDDHMLGAGMWLKKTVLPLHVSFEGMTVKEQGGGASGTTGYFQGGPGAGQDLTHYPDGAKGKVGADTRVNSVNELVDEDKCQLMDKSSDPWPRPIQVGSMTWHVPHLYTAGGVSDKSFTIMAQTMGIVDGKGTVTITKGKGAQYSRTPAQPMWNPGSSGGTDGEVDTPKSEQDASDRRVGAEPEPDESDDGGITVTDGFADAEGGGTDDATPDGSAAGDNRPARRRTPRARPAAPPPGPATVTHRTRETPLEGAGGPDRLTVGVGERVDFTSTQTGSWTATGANRGTRRTQRGRTYRWQAPPAAGTVTVTFTPGATPGRGASPPTSTGTPDNPPQSFEFTIVAPSDLQFLKTSEDTYRAGRQGAGMHQSVYMLPMSVSFANVQWLEVPGPASSASGYFSGRPLPYHRPNRRWLGLNNANGGITDHAAFWGFPSPWVAGSFTWVIPNKYRVDGEGGAGHEFVNVNQVCTMEGTPNAGRTTVTKGTPTGTTATVTRDPGAAPAPRGGRGRRGEANPQDHDQGTAGQEHEGHAGFSGTDIAERGVAGASDSLPHLDQIQESFGRHDVSNVRTAIGGDAADSTRDLGAEAYTFGDRVGFAETPDLHTAAHEAAHVVQQRGSVTSGIDGGPGDVHEQHADAVADAVVRGESAEGLLDQIAGTGGAAPVVQRKTAQAPVMVNAFRYLEYNAFRVSEVIWPHIVNRRLPEPHPRMRWRDEKTFYKALILSFTNIFKFGSRFDVARVLAPGEPYTLVDELRPLTKAVEDSDGDMRGGRVGPATWSAPVGLAIAQLVEQALVDAMYRLGPRWVAAADAKGAHLITADDIPRSHPIDRYVVGPMCKDGIFTLDAPTGGKPKAPAPRKPVTLTWVGRTNKELWNWVRAEPADATAEEVSAKLFAYKAAEDGETRADYYATFLTAAPPMFGIPPQWAKNFDETKDFRPDKIPAADTDPDHQITALGGSNASDAQSLAEVGGGDPKAKGTPKPSGEHDNIVEDATSQAKFLKTKLAGWKLGEAADKTLSFLERRKRDGADGAKWVPVLAKQRENLTRISTGILQLDTAIDQMKLSRTGDQAGPLREIMRFYADATATSHLDKSCNRMILRAANAQTSLSARGLGASLRDMDMSVDMMRQGVSETGYHGYDRKQISIHADQLRTRSIELQSRMMRGGKVDANEIEDLQVTAESNALRARFVAVEDALKQLEVSADEAGSGLSGWIASLPSSKFRNLKDATNAIRGRVADIRTDWEKAQKYADMTADEDDNVDERKNLRKAVNTTKAAFADLAKKDDISNFLKEGANTVKWQQFRTAVVKIAALLGVSIVGGFVGGFVARGVAGMMMGTSGAVAIESLGLGGTIIARGAGLIADTTITSVGQAAIFGESLGTTFLENLLQNIGSAGILKVLGNRLDEAARLEKATASVWQKGAAAGTVVLKESAAITGHAIMGMALGYVAHKIVTGKQQPPPATLEEWLLQGASIAVGRYIGKGMEASRARQQKLKLQAIEGGAKLATDTEKLAALAKKVEQNPQAKDAMELLQKRHQLLVEEMKILEHLEKSPDAMSRAKMSKADVTKAKGELKRQMTEVHQQGFGDVPLHLSGLNELIPGALWSGTKKQVTDAIQTAKEAGIPIKVKEDPQGGKWHVEIQGRKITIEERFDPNAAKTANPDPKFGKLAVGAHEPVGKVHGNTQKEPNRVAVLAEANTALQALAGRIPGSTPGTNTIEITINGKRRTIVVDAADPAPGNAPPIATYKITDDGITITLSTKAAPHHIERALAHELAEINHVIRRGLKPGSEGKNALAPGSSETTLTAHDVGRLAEIDVMARQLDEARGKVPRDEATITRLQEEGLELVKHLGLTGEGGTRRQRLLEAEARRIGDPLIRDSLAQLKRIVDKPPPAGARPPPGVTRFVNKLSNPFERTKVADEIAAGHAYDKHVIKEGQFKVDDGHGGKRNMTRDEFSAEIQKVIETGQNKHMKRPPGRRIYILGNNLVIHHPNGPDNGTSYRSSNAAKEYADS